MMSSYRGHGSSLWSLSDVVKYNESNQFRTLRFLEQKALTRAVAWQQGAANA
jgi:hypothetical protein